MKLQSLLLVLLLAQPAFAEPATYTADPAGGKSTMAWDGKAHGEVVHGTTHAVNATFTGNVDDVTDQPHIQVEADLNTMETGNHSRDSTMKGSGCLDTAKYPTVKWVLKSVTLGPGSSKALTEGQKVVVQAVGDVTLHGVTKETPVVATMVRQGNTLHVTGTLDILLTDFQVKPPQFLFFKMENGVHINLDIYAAK